MLWDSFDMGNPEVAVVKDTFINELMKKVTAEKFTPVNPRLATSYFSGISNAWAKAGATITVAYVRDDGNVRVGEAYILPAKAPDGGFVTKGSGVTTSSVPWVVWIPTPADSESPLIWDTSGNTCLCMKNNVLGVVHQTSVRVSITHDIRATTFQGTHYYLADGKVCKAVKYEFPEPQPTSAKKKNKKYNKEEEFKYTPPEVTVESPFAVLMTRGKK